MYITLFNLFQEFCEVSLYGLWITASEVEIQGNCLKVTLLVGYLKLDSLAHALDLQFYYAVPSV